MRTDSAALHFPRLYRVRLVPSHTPDAEFHFDFDPCPCPRPETYNSLVIPWGRSNFVNPPFRTKDGVDGKGPTAFVRKAIQEQKQGSTSVLIIPVQSYVNLLLEAGAELRSLGRVRWLDVTTGEPCKSPSPICCFILRGNKDDGIVVPAPVNPTGAIEPSAGHTGAHESSEAKQRGESGAIRSPSK